MAKEFIKIKKIIDGHDAIEAIASIGSFIGKPAKPATVSKVEPDTLLLDDLISFRAWHKNDKDKAIPGEFTQLTIVSHGKEGGLWTCRILESEDAFTERIKEFRPVISLA